MGLFSGKKKKSDSRNESRGREVIEGKIEGVTEGPFDDSKYTEYQNKINEISSNIENHTKKLNELLKNLDWNNPDTFKSSLNNVASTANNVNSGFESLNTIKKELKEELTKSDDESKGKIQKLSNTISSVFSSSDKALADKLKKRDLTFPANTPELTKLLADTLRDNLKIPVNTGITINYIYRKAEQAGREELDEFRAMFKLLNNFVNSPPAIQKYLDENNTGVIISKGINGVEGSIQTILDSGCIDLNNVAKSVKDKLSNSNKEADSPIYLKLKFLAGNVSLILEILINRIKSNEKIDKNTNFNYPNKFIKEWNSLKEKYDKSIQNAPVKIDNLYIGVDNIKKALTNFVNFFGENGINIKMYQKLNECVPIFNNIFEFKKIKDLSKLNELQNFINENKQAINELEFIAGSAEIIEKAEDSDDKEYLDTNIKNDMSNFTKVYNKFIKANKEVGDVVTELVESINKVREKGKVESTNALVDLSTLLKHLIEGFDKLANIGSLIGLNLKRVSDNHNKKIEKYFLKYGNVGNYDNLKNAAYDNSAKIKNIGRERVPRLIRDEKRKLLPVLKDAKNFESKMKTMKIIEYLKTKVKKDLEDCKSEFESVNEEVDEK